MSSSFTFVAQRSYDPSSFAQRLQRKTRPRGNGHAPPEITAGDPTTQLFDPVASGNSHERPRIRSPSRSSTPTSNLPSQRDTSHERPSWHSSASATSATSATSRRTIRSKTSLTESPSTNASKRRFALQQQAYSSPSSSKRRKTGERDNAQSTRLTTGQTTAENSNKDGLCCFCSCPLGPQSVQCQKCPVQLCARCTFNAPAIHPNHPFRVINDKAGVNWDGIVQEEEDAVRDENTGDENTGGQDTRDEEAISERSETPAVVEHSVSVEVTGAVPPEIRCTFCAQSLLRLWYDCPSCPLVHFCPDCSKLHPLHPLTAVRMPPIAGQKKTERQSDTSDCGSKGNRGISHCDVGEGEDVEDAEDIGDSEDTEDEDAISSHGEEADQDHDTHDGDADHPQRERLLDSSSGEDDDIDEDDFSDPGVTSSHSLASTSQASWNRSLDAIISRTSRNVTKALNDAMLEVARFSYRAGREGKKEPKNLTPKTRQAFLAFGAGDASLFTKPHRRWLKQDRRKLARLKTEGWAVEQIADQLGRSPGAVAQQWRKQQAQ